MKASSIITAARTIMDREEALAWLEEYGGRVSGEDDSVSVQVRLNFAGSCRGSKEAESILAAKALNDFRSIVAAAVEDCRNTIEICRQTIIRELQVEQCHCVQMVEK